DGLAFVGDLLARRVEQRELAVEAARRRIAERPQHLDEGVVSGGGPDSKAAPGARSEDPAHECAHADSLRLRRRSEGHGGAARGNGDDEDGGGSEPGCEAHADLRAGWARRYRRDGALPAAVPGSAYAAAMTDILEKAKGALPTAP